MEKTIEPVIEDRFSNAKESLAVLRDERVLTTQRAYKPRRPKDTPIALTKYENQLLVKIPPLWPRIFNGLLFRLLLLALPGFLALLVWAVLVICLNADLGFLLLLVLSPLSLLLVSAIIWLLLMSLMNVLWSDALEGREALAKRAVGGSVSYHQKSAGEQPQRTAHGGEDASPPVSSFLWGEE